MDVHTLLTCCIIALGSGQNFSRAGAANQTQPARDLGTVVVLNGARKAVAEKLNVTDKLNSLSTVVFAVLCSASVIELGCKVIEIKVISFPIILSVIALVMAQMEFDALH